MDELSMGTLALVDACDQAPDWLSLPTGALQHIFCAASSWQIPGSCWAAPVCRAWRSAAAACRGVCLLYVPGHPAADRSFKAWLPHNSQQLEAFLVGSHNDSALNKVLGKLATTAAAAKAAGRPLPLRTLRVLSGSVQLGITGKLVARLPRLRCLQLRAASLGKHPKPGVVLKQLAPLQQATQLRELSFEAHEYGCARWLEVAGVLPANLERLSWQAPWHTKARLPVPDLSHLTRLTFLRLSCCDGQQGPLSRHLPPGLQQLEPGMSCTRPSELQQERKILTHFSCLQGECTWWSEAGELQVLRTFINLTSMSTIIEGEPGWRKLRTAAEQLVKLSALGLWARSYPEEADLGQLVPAVSCCQSLRRLVLYARVQQQPPQLAALTQVTQLLFHHGNSGWMRQDWPPLQAWVAAFSSMSQLRWLSMPPQLLTSTGNQALLGKLEQLQVLVLGDDIDRYAANAVWSQAMQWLLECSLEELPPRLRLLGLSCMTVHPVDARLVRRRLQRRLGSSGCEVVVGSDLDVVCDPAMQLAGLPVTLQQALA